MNHPRDQFCIEHAHELLQVLKMPASRAVVLDVTTMPPEEARGWERELNRSLHTCGCDEGTAALLLTGMVLSLVAWLHWDVVSVAPVFSAAIGIAGCVAAIGAGKAFGRLRGRRRLKRTVLQLHAELARRMRP
jgi:hypothetical protein